MDQIDVWFLKMYKIHLRPAMSSRKISSPWLSNDKGHTVIQKNSIKRVFGYEYLFESYWKKSYGMRVFLRLLVWQVQKYSGACSFECLYWIIYETLFLCMIMQDGGGPRHWCRVRRPKVAGRLWTVHEGRSILWILRTVQASLQQWCSFLVFSTVLGGAILL